MRRLMAALSVCALLWCCPSFTRVFAGDQHIIRIATLAPRGTPAFKTLDVWNANLQKKTNGRVKLTFLAGGVSRARLRDVGLVRRGLWPRVFQAAHRASHRLP
jgi:TRAP-type C4-dicarboxylate transport system substrate-binding protein